LIDRDDLSEQVIDFARKPGVHARFLAVWDFPIWAVRDSFDGEALWAARSRATQRSKTALARYSISRCGFAIKSSVSAGQRSDDVQNLSHL
jgi:hypothetical protein